MPPFENAGGFQRAGNATHEDSNLQRDLEFGGIEKEPENLQRRPVGKLNPMDDQSFKTLFENVPDAMVIIDADTGKFVDANARAVRLFGLYREELIGLGPLDISPPIQPDGRISAEVIQEKIQELLSENPKPFEWVHRQSSGRDILCEIRHARLPVSDRKLYCATAIDITERRQAEDQIRQYKQILESTQNPVGLVDLSFIYRYANEPYSQALDKPIREIIGHSVPDLFGRDFFETAMGHHYERCFDGENVNYQTWFDFPGWGRRYMDVRYYPLRDIEGRVTAAVTNVHDITEIKQLEIKLQESEEQFRAFMDNNPASIYIKDEKDRHIYVNPAACDSERRTQSEFIGMTTKELWPPDIAENLIALDKAVLRGDAPRICEEWRNTEEGDRRWRRDIKFPIDLVGGKKLLGGIAFDITESKQTEQALSEQLEFERLIADIAARLAQVQPDHLDMEINETIQALGRFLRTERAFLAQFYEDGRSLVITNVWAVEGTSRSSSIFDIDFAAELPWVAQKIRDGGMIKAGPGLVGLPDEANDLRTWLKADGISSGLVVPVRVEQKAIGMLGLDTIVEPRDYP